MGTTSKLNAWVLASRPKTLFAILSPFLLGSSISYSEGKFKPFIAFLALISAILIQIATNFVNDLYDFKKGADSLDERLGPKRMVSSGSISEKNMKKGILITFSLALLIGIYVSFESNYLILVAGMLSLLAGYAYTAGPFPLAYFGLGDLFVFLFFGLVATVGFNYIHSQEFSIDAIYFSVPLGAFLTNILVVNNLRDIESDRKVNKKTLAVLIGAKATQIQFTLLTCLAYMMLYVYYAIFEDSSFFIFLPFLTLPLTIRLIKKIFILKGKDLNSLIWLTSFTSLLYSILLSLYFIIK